MLCAQLRGGIQSLISSFIDGKTMIELILGILIIVITLAVFLFVWYYIKEKKSGHSISEDQPETDSIELKNGIIPHHERMEWTDGEKIIVYHKGCLRGKKRELEIMSHTNEGLVSSAKVSGTLPVRRKGSHTYYGVYPASAFQTSRGKVVVSGSIPKIQKLDQDTENPHLYKADIASNGYMYAISSSKLMNSDGSKLRFLPLFTSYVFMLYSPADNYMDDKLMSLRLVSEQEGVFLSGSFKARLDPHTGKHTPIKTENIITGSNSINVYFDKGVKLGKSPEEAIIINLISIPMDHTQLKLMLRFEDGRIRSINLMSGKEWITVKACKKIIFSNLAVPGLTSKKM